MNSNKKYFIYNLITSYGSSLISAVLSLVSVPLALNYWGREVYGIWTILTSFSTYIMASGLGIDNSTGILMTKNVNLNVKISILKKGVKLLFICSIIIAVIISIITLLFPDWLKVIGKMNEENYSVAKIAGLIFIAGVIINLPFNAIANSLQAFGKAYINTLIGIVQNVCNFFCIIITIKLQLTLPIYILTTVINTFVFSIIKLFILVIIVRKCYHTVLGSEIDLLEIRNNLDNRYKTILRTGINMTLYGLAILLIPNFSNLIISNNIDVSSLVPYSLIFRLYTLVIYFATNTNVALAPILGIEYGKGNWEWLNKTYKKMFCTSVSFSVFLVTGVIWLGESFITIWTGNNGNYVGNVISIILGIYFFEYVLNNINIILINAFNYTKKVWLISWADGIIFLLFSHFAIKRIGIVSIPLGLCLGAFCISSWLYPLHVYKKSERRFIYDFKFLFKNIIILFSSILVYLIIHRLKLNFILQTIICVLGIIVTTIVLYLILPTEIKESLLEKIRRRK